MIGPGLKIRLFDTALALRYTGFEQPTLYAELGRPIIVKTDTTSLDQPHTFA